MPVSKDFYCEQCDTEIYDVRVDSTSINSHFHWCDGCEQMRTFKVLCNGGVKGRRWRYVDWTEDSAANLVRYHGVRTDADDGAGGKEHDNPRFSAEGVDDRRQRMKHERDKKRGKGKLVFSG